MTSWHATDAALRDWVDGVIAPVAGASVEQHMVHCERCRAAVASLVRTEDVPGSWESILEVVETPRPTFAARFLTRIGLSQSDVGVLTATPVLRLGWVIAVTAVIGFAVIASSLADDERSVALFLTVAPLVPVVGVAFAYGPSVDPSYETVLASPYRMIRLMMLRTAAVLVVSLPLLQVGGLLLPFSATVTLGWLLPSVGFTVVVLAASSWFDPEYAAAATGIGWVAAVGWAVHHGDPLLVLQPVAMAGYVLMLATGLLVVTRRVRRTTPSWRL